MAQGRRETVSPSFSCKNVRGDEGKEKKPFKMVKKTGQNHVLRDIFPGIAKQVKKGLFGEEK
jgi:hypothetical protein